MNKTEHIIPKFFGKGSEVERSDLTDLSTNWQTTGRLSGSSLSFRNADYIGGSEVSPQSPTLNIMAIVKVSVHDTPEIGYAPRFVGSEVPEFEWSTARIRLSGAYEYVIEINPPSASQVAATLRRRAVSLEDVVISELLKWRKNSVFDRRSKNPLPSDRS